MAINSRNKGARFERWVADRLTVWSHVSVKRILDQVREGGHDLRLGRWRLECKSYKSLGLMERALRQCEVDALPDDIPIVIAKQDRGEPIVAMRLEQYLNLMQRVQLGLTNRPWE